MLVSRRTDQGPNTQSFHTGEYYNTILERLLVWVQNPLGSFLSCSFFSYSIKPSPSELGSIHKLLAFDYKPYRSVGKGRVIG